MAAAPSPRRILLIDDNPATCEAVSMILGTAGYCVALASNGADALARLRSGRRPDLILLDLSMPVLDGRAFRRAQQEDPSLATIPIVVFSGTVKAEEEAAALGAAGCLRKPVDAGRLLETIRRCLEGKGAVA
jgi:CheY-like chemotaxis protein